MKYHALLLFLKKLQIIGGALRFNANASEHNQERTYSFTADQPTHCKEEKSNRQVND